MVRPGQTLLKKYRVEALIGQGGMASVWQGTHIATDRRVAIKVLDDRFLDNARVVERFGREARTASAIRHESIVDVLDLDRTEEGAPFLVMELLEGESLADRIERKGHLEESEMVAIAELLLDAVHAAHEAGVIHRDLKPDNVMIVPARRGGEEVKVLDFGISSRADEVSSLTATGSLLGTPHYMSPEQARGRKDLDRRADIYAMGVLLYEAATGDVPFDAENYNALIQEILNVEPVPPRARGAIISEALERVILRAMSKDREGRPATAEALRLELLAASPLASGAPVPGSFVQARPQRAAPVDGSATAGAVSGAGRPGAAGRAALPTEELDPLAPTVPLPQAMLAQAEARAAASARRSNQSPLELLPSTPPPGPTARLELDERSLRPHLPTPPTGLRRAGEDVAGSSAAGAPRLVDQQWARVVLVAMLVLVLVGIVVRLVVEPGSLVLWGTPAPAEGAPAH